MRQAETLPRLCLLQAVPILGTKDITTTMLCAAMAGTVCIAFVLITVIIGEFVSCLDILDRHNPDGVAKLFRLAVWITRMIDIACSVLASIPINGIALIQSKDIDIACG